jgi:hypothetical protein
MKKKTDGNHDQNLKPLLEAFNAVARALEPLSPSEQVRVLHAAAITLGLESELQEKLEA